MCMTWYTHGIHSKKLMVTLTYFLSFEMRQNSIFYLCTEFLHTQIAPKAIIRAVCTLMRHHIVLHTCAHIYTAVPCARAFIRGYIRRRVKASSSPESTTTAAGLCAMRGLPGTRLGHFFGGLGPLIPYIDLEVDRTLIAKKDVIAAIENMARYNNLLQPVAMWLLRL